MHLSELMIENFRQFGKTDPPFTLGIAPGVTALVGENDSGKTAIVDAIRYALLTRDTEYIRVQPNDFYINTLGVAASEIVVRCKLSDLSIEEKGAFAEHLTYDAGEISLYVYWRARNLMNTATSRRVADVSVRSGKDGAGPAVDLQARQLLSAAYLKPLRDAAREMAPGTGSRLSQVLVNFPGIDVGNSFDAETARAPEAVAELSLAGMAAYFRYLVNGHQGIGSAQAAINTDYLTQLALTGENLHGRISYAQSGSDASQLRQILERLQLDLLEGPQGTPRGQYGLGSSNLLYMACELLLLGKDAESLPLLLIEEPEAHLQPQRQLRLMEFLERAAQAKIPGSRPVQVIVTTHSPNLASKIPLNNVVLLERQRAYSMARGQTKLDKGDYRFLERFLDATKANLFFAKGVIVVEGDAETIIVPALAKLLDRDLATHGVSIVNVGGTGLRRYARIFQRADAATGEPSVPVACLADMDVMPDCAPQILKLVTDDDDDKWEDSHRRWLAVRDFEPEPPSPEQDTSTTPAPKKRTLAQRRAKLSAGDGGSVRTFVSDYWTLEYDLCRAGLAKHVYIAALLAKNDDSLNEDIKSREDVISAATEQFGQLKKSSGSDLDVLSSLVYKLFAVDRVSKAVAAQYFVEVLELYPLTAAELQGSLPAYIVDAIGYATRRTLVAATSAGGAPNA